MDEKRAGSSDAGAQARTFARADAAANAPEIDAMLVERFVAGDVGAFERLVSRHRAHVVHFIFRMTGDLHFAEDLGQEVFVKIHQKAAAFRGGSTVTSWIFAIARNMVIDHERIKFRIFGRRGRARALDEAVLPASGALPESNAARSEIRRIVAAEVTRLPEPYRSAMVLVDINQLGYEDAALALGCNRKTLSSRVSRARRLLRDRIDPRLIEGLV